MGVSYRPVAIHVQACGLGGYTAHVVLEDDGLPDRECPVHGWDGPPRNEFGTMLVETDDGLRTAFDVQALGKHEELRDCVCPVTCGFDMEHGPYDAFGRKRAYRKALRGEGGKLYPRMRERG